MGIEARWPPPRYTRPGRAPIATGMRRPPATVVVLAHNVWEATKACLEALRPTLGVHDQVVVVDNGSTDATATQLRRLPWVEVVAAGANRGIPTGRNLGAARARHDVVVFLDNDTVPTGRWLDTLVAALMGRPEVAAAGPRSNTAPGAQAAEGASYPGDDLVAMRRFARTWAHEHDRQVEDVAVLSGFCLAVRRSAFEAAGGFDEGYSTGGYEDDDLCNRLRAAGGSLVLAHGAFVHHQGRRTFEAAGLDWFEIEMANRRRFAARWPAGPSTRDVPLVSACLITKDEEANLEACLASLEGLADEVVVYDTGSTDATVALARRLGATVVEGFWDDDFSRARNAALARCRGEWIAWLDADETLVCDDPVALRTQLRRTALDVDGYSVAIHNLTGSGAGPGFVHSACRLFRRARCEWVGRLHEQVAHRGDHRGISQAVLELASLRHTGYLDEVMRARAKTERNLRVARAEVERADGWDAGFSLTSLGRSCMTAGRFDEALERCTEALARTTNPITRRLAARTAAEALLGLGRPEEALTWVQRLRSEGGTVQADVVEAQARLAAGDHEGALGVLDRIDTARADDDGFHHDATMYARWRADALAGLGRPGEAADVLLGVLAGAGVLDTHLGRVVELLEQAGRPLAELAAAIPAERAPTFLAQVLQLHDPVADAVLEACVAAGTAPAATLATAATLARRLPVDRALVWSARLRAAGQVAACPLLAMAADGARPALERARAAATARRAFADERAVQLFVDVLASADGNTRAAIVAEASQLCPELVPAPAPPSPPREQQTPAAAAGPRGAHTTARLAASIVIPCFNRADLTLQCLQALAASTEPGTYEVVLVDNGSTDATAQLADLAGPLFSVIRNEENLGFARACNQGAAAARAPVVVFLNNDVLARPGWLPALLAPFEHDPTVGIVGARLLFPDGSLQHAGIVIGTGVADGRLQGAHRFYQMPGDTPEALVAGEVQAVTGAVLAIRREAWDAVGGFDEGYWNGLEDVDLCLSVGDQGWKVVYEPSAVLVHLESQSGAERWSKFDANVERFHQRWQHRFVTPGPARARRHPPARTEAAGTGARSRRHRLPRVRWVGDVYADHSLATVTRELVVRLADHPAFALEVDSAEQPPFHPDALRALRHVRGAGRPAGRDPVAVEVRHCWPPLLTPPSEGALVVIQPWEYGGIPKQWILPMQHVVDEVWVPSQWVRDCYVASGVDPTKVAVVPNGVDTERFRPEGDRFPLRTDRTVRLLFVGGTIHRKGFDLLLEAYLDTFGPGDDVCLVVKPFGADSVYAREAMDERVRAAAADPANAAIEVVDRRLTRDELAALYRSCDVLVHPYRGEGFGLPVAEAMACGLPAVVTGDGACAEFCDESTGWVLGSRRVPTQILGFVPGPAGFWLAEPDPDHLRATLRTVVDDAPGRARRGAAARARIVDAYTWDHAAARTARRLQELVAAAGRPETGAALSATTG